METASVDNYLTALREAKTDNEKFAALLMVAKVTKESSCDKGLKRQILEAVGPKFFSRLLKTKNVPDACPENIFKSVALSILSALSGDVDVSTSPSMTDNVSSFNMIVLLNPSETEPEDRQLVDDTYECFNSLCRTTVGQENLVKARSLSALSQAIVEQMYGCEKAMDVLVALLSSGGPELWVGCEPALHSLMGSFAKDFKTEMGHKKFELCKTLIFLLTTMPRNLVKTIDPPWAVEIVSGLDGILRSKLGSLQREPALKLTAMLIDVCGIQCVLPPTVSDSKLFLLITHLSCVEVRMVLEDTDLKIAFQKGRLLSSCYSILETVINHMTAGPSLQLDDRQVLQLHSAMVGAFAAVLHFLKRVAVDSNIQWGSVVLATVRVLAAWLSEETSALRNEVYELIPFLVDISKKCVPPYEEVDEVNTKHKTSEKQTSSSPTDDHENNNEKNCDVVMDSLSETLDKALHKVKSEQKDDKEEKEEKDTEEISTHSSNLEVTEQLKHHCNQTTDCDENTNNSAENVVLESHEMETDIDAEKISEQSEQRTLDKVDQTESVQVQKHDSNKVSEKHVSFNVSQNSDSDHVISNGHMTPESCDNAQNSLNHSSHEEASSIVNSRSSLVELNQNNSALNTEQKSLPTDEQNSAVKPVPSSLTDTDSDLKKDQAVTIDSIVDDGSCSEESEMSEKELQDLHIRVDIFRFLLPGLCHLTSEDLPRMILVKEGMLALLDLYLWRQWNRFTQNPQSREVQSSLVIICNILLNLVIIEPKLVVEKEEFSHVLLLVVKSVLELELGDCLVVWSHMITLGLMLLRALSKKTDSFLELESINRFFVSAVRFLSGAYTVEYKKKMAAGITISEGYRQTWDQICQTWFLSMQAFCACVPLFSELPSVILKSGWVPALIKSLLQVKGRGVEEETRSCFLLLLTTIATSDKAIREVVREKGGEELARLYKSKDLEEALKKKC